MTLPLAILTELERVGDRGLAEAVLIAGVNMQMELRQVPSSVRAECAALAASGHLIRQPHEDRAAVYFITAAGKARLAS